MKREFTLKFYEFVGNLPDVKTVVFYIDHSCDFYALIGF